LRAVPAARAIRYVGVDLSPSMLRRARRRAASRGLTGVEFVQADATAIPLPSASVDLLLSFWGLHCYADPQSATAEAARILKPGGLAGSSILRGTDSLRQRLLVRPHTGGFGRIGSQSEIESWLAEAGLDLTSARRSGPLLFFDGPQASLNDAQRRGWDSNPRDAYRRLTVFKVHERTLQAACPSGLRISCHPPCHREVNYATDLSLSK
jgi:SAM-dependent methyltransferase